MRNRNQVRTYTRSESVVFRKTNEPFGGLSNMAGGYPIRVNGVSIRTSEALYQACRFPHLPDVQRMIIGEISPMTAKMRSRPYRKNSRSDWDRVRVRIMRWCLRMKLANNWDEFSELLLLTGDRPIIEESRKDDFWGAKPSSDGSKLIGMNVLGRLLMELREQVRLHGRNAFLNVAPPDVANFLLLGQPIGTWVITADDRESGDAPKQQNDLFSGLPEKTTGVEIRITAGQDPGGDGAMKLRPYPEYKYSGVPWLGEIPRHWKIISARQIGHLFKGSGGNKNDEVEKGVPCVRYGDLYTTHEFFILNTRACIPPDNLKSYTRIRFGDVLFAASGETIEDIGRSAVNLIRGEACCGGDIIILRPTAEIDPRFLGYALESPAARYQKSSMGRGFTVVHIYGAELKSLVTPCPPVEEQTQIARFLDWKTAQIDRFIRAKRQLIERLKEQKQALINQAVTGRIDVRTSKPYPEYKDSGVPWLGKVPAGWQILPIKRVVRFNPSKSETGDSPSVNKQVCFLPMERISEEGQIDCSEKRQLSEVWEGFTYFRRGDVVLAKITPCFENGKGAYLSELETEYGFGTTELFVLRPTQKINGAFLRFVTATKTFRWLGAQNMTGAAGQQRVPSSFVKNFQIGLPPLDEQEAIVSFIQRISKSIDTAITRTQREIDLIQEYRTRLIADVVTGKLDVREVEVPSFKQTTKGDTDTNAPSPLVAKRQW